MAIVLSGGTIITSESEYSADLRIEGEIITAIGTDLARSTDQVVDVRGKLIFPGGIDPHTHFDLTVGSTTTADDFRSGSAAAIMGGTTTIIDFATQNKGESLAKALANWQAKASGCTYTDYGFHLAISDWNEAVQAEMTQMLSAGITSFKLYLAYKGSMQVNDGVVLQALQEGRKLGALIAFHCENGDVIEVLVGQALMRHQTAPFNHALTRPAVIEREAVGRIMALAEIADASVYIVHLSTAQGLDEVNRARKRGIEVYAETCPQYLLLDERSYYAEGFEGAKYVMSPPLRTPSDQVALWQGLADTDIDTLATDHCSFNYQGQKELGKEDFSRIPNGAPGVEHRMELLYTYGVLTGKISLQKFVALTSTNAAKLFGLYPHKGIIAVGSDADLIIWNPEIEHTITALTQKQRVDYSPYEGWKIRGKAVDVFLRGQRVLNSGILQTAEPKGKYLIRKTFHSLK